MFYQGIYSHQGKVQATPAYEDASSIPYHYPLLKVCEAPTKEELDLVVKKSLDKYRPLPGLMEDKITYTLYTNEGEGWIHIIESRVSDSGVILSTRTEIMPYPPEYVSKWNRRAESEPNVVRMYQVK